MQKKTAGLPVTKTPNLDTQPVAIFGLPFTNAGLEGTTLQCMDAIRRNSYDADLFHITTFGVPLATKCFGWRTKTVHRSEPLSVARHANASLITSKYLRTICKLLGSPLAPPIDPTDLLNAICRELSKKDKSVFILGGVEKITKAAAIKLHDTFHGLRLVGIATPLIFTEGVDLINSKERDALLVEQINATHADMLIVNLGSPKQELWLERVRTQLKVPLVFTVGDLLTKIAAGKAILDTPSKANDAKGETRTANYTNKQHTNHHSFLDNIKLTWMAIPLVVFHTVNRSVFQWFHEKNTSTAMPTGDRLFLSAYRSIAFISLPELIDETNVDLLKKKLEEVSIHDVVVLDFLKTRHIQPEGFHLLIEAWLNRQKQNKEIYGFYPTSDIKCLMRVHRTWDLFKEYLCNTSEALMSRLVSNGETIPFYDTFTQSDNRVVISILGALDHRVDFDAYLRKLTPIIGQKDCVLDLACCTFIDNSGFAFLLNLRKQLLSQERRLTLSRVSKPLRRQFRSTDVENLFEFESGQ